MWQIKYKMHIKESNKKNNRFCLPHLPQSLTKSRFPLILRGFPARRFISAVADCGRASQRKAASLGSKTCFPYTKNLFSVWQSRIPCGKADPFMAHSFICLTPLLAPRPYMPHSLICPTSLFAPRPYWPHALTAGQVPLAARRDLPRTQRSEPA